MPRSAAIVATLLATTVAAGCGSTASTPEGAAKARQPVAASSPKRLVLPTARRDEVVRAATSRVRLLAHPAKLPAAELRLLSRSVPPPLPVIPEHIASVDARYWVAPGIVTPDDAPGVCVFQRVEASGDTAVGTYCFNLQTIDQGMAYLQADVPQGLEIVGLAPEGVRSLRLEVAGKASTCPVDAGVYVCLVKGSWKTIEVSANGTPLYVVAQPQRRPASG